MGVVMAGDVDGYGLLGKSCGMLSGSNGVYTRSLFYHLKLGVVLYGVLYLCVDLRMGDNDAN